MEPNHRSQDCICLIGRTSNIAAKFVYGPFDVAALTGEKVVLSIRNETSETGWTTLAEKDTDNSGKVQFSIPKGKI